MGSVFRYVLWMALCGLMGACFTIVIFYADISSKLVEHCWSVALAQEVSCSIIKVLRALSGTIPGLFIGYLIAKKS